jgi:kynureninase
MTMITRQQCRQWDRDDDLAELRSEFSIPDGVIYLDGNSLGAMPSQALSQAYQTVERDWGLGLIQSWNNAGWFDLPYSLGDRVAELIGGSPGEVVVTDSTSINLYKVLAAALQLRPERKVILLESSNFPTNNYITQGLITQLKADYTIRYAEADELADAINDELAAVCLTQVHYKTGRLLDMHSITEKTHDAGAISIWDLCHSAGAMEVDLNTSGVDFAIGCTYKYLNGGPGSPAYLFMATRHHNQIQQPLTGWWGHADPFAFERDYRPATGIGQMLSGTQPIVSLALIDKGLEIFEQVQIRALREKSMRMGQLLIDLVEQRCSAYEFDLISPRQAEQRGSQVSFSHDQGYAIMKALIAEGVIGDFRAPDTVRFGIAPLYIRYSDIWDAVDTLVRVMTSKSWQRFDAPGPGPDKPQAPGRQPITVT